MGRSKGYKLSDEQRQRLIDGRRRAKEQRESSGTETRASTSSKPVIWITGKEKTCFDFIPKLRDAFRKIGNYTILPKIEREINDKDFWKNPNWIMNKLVAYVTMEKKE